MERSTGSWTPRTSSGWLRSKATEQKVTTDNLRLELGAGCLYSPSSLSETV
jgi:hypothetical protein